jgi:hypothetical protein
MSMLPAASQGAGFCKLAAGSCAIPATNNGDNCFCNTIFGPLQGNVQLAPTNTDTTPNLIEQVTKSNAAALTLQIFSYEKGLDPNLNQWLSGIDPSINIILAARARLQSDPITAVWFTPDVSEPLVRICVLSLLQNGVDIKSIEVYTPRLSEGRPIRRGTIQLGRDPDNRSRNVISVEAILKSPIPIYGDEVPSEKSAPPKSNQ